MAKGLIEIDGEFYRKRRGVLVKIPAKWFGKVTHKQTIRKRNTISRRTKSSKK